jgi:2-(3-amino-3-carboxypropyl)histidine synthase
VIRILKAANITYYVILLSELTNEKLNQYADCECFVQIACPRISIDWGSYFTKPVITPYESFVTWGNTDWRDRYPMDYYSYDGGEWSNYTNKKPKKK